MGEKERLTFPVLGEKQMIENGWQLVTEHL